MNNETQSWDLEAERDLWRDICREDFYWFFQIAWGAAFFFQANPQDRWFHEEVHRPLVTWAEGHVKEWEKWRQSGIRRRKKLAVVIPRFCGKTLLFTNCLNLWIQLRDPNSSNYIGSETAEKAEQFLDPIRQVITGEDTFSWFTWLYGNWQGPVWRSDFMVSRVRTSLTRKEPSFGTWGVEGGLTGKHPDVGFLDDPLSEERIKDTGVWIKAVNEHISAVRPAFRTNSLFAIICTRYRDNDPVGYFMASTKEGVHSWTGMPPVDHGFEASPKGEWDVYFLQIRDSEGRSIVPNIWPDEELARWESSDPVQFVAQGMNTPGVGEHMPITPEQIEGLWVDPKDVPNDLIITIHCDTAFKDLHGRRASGDSSVVVVAGHDPRGNGDVYYLEGYGSDKWSAEQFNDKVADLILKWETRGAWVRALTDESEKGGKRGTWKASIESWCAGRKVQRMPKVLLLPRGGRKNDKLIRITEAIDFWLDGHMKLVRGAPGVHSLIQQVLRLGTTAHDDWVDAMADIFHKDVYRRMMFHQPEADGMFPSQPGDDLLKGFRRPKSETDLRAIYDHYVPDPFGDLITAGERNRDWEN